MSNPNSNPEKERPGYAAPEQILNRPTAEGMEWAGPLMPPAHHLAGCPSCAEGVWISAENHRAEVSELEERFRNFLSEYRAVLKLALEMAMELRIRCNEDIHHDQVAEIGRRLAAAGMKDNEPSSATAHAGAPRCEEPPKGGSQQRVGSRIGNGAREQSGAGGEREETP